MVRIHRICHRLRHDGWRGGNEDEDSLLNVKLYLPPLITLKQIRFPFIKAEGVDS